MYCNYEKLLYKYCDFNLWYLDCNFTLHFGNDIPLKHCKITNIFNSVRLMLRIYEFLVTMTKKNYFEFQDINQNRH